MNTMLTQLFQWPPTVTTVIGAGLFLFGLDYALTGNVVQATLVAGAFKMLCPQDGGAVDQVAQGAGQLLDAAKKMLVPLACVVGIGGLLTACGAPTPVAIGPQPAGGTAATTTVPSAVAGLATFSDTDLKAAMTELAATNGGNPPTTVPLVDDYQCVAWIDGQLPSWVAMANGAIPASGATGPVSAFISVKIAAVNGQSAAQDFTTQLGPEFAHNCGAAFADDANFIVNALAQVGIKVAIPATGGISALIPGL